MGIYRIHTSIFAATKSAISRQPTGQQAIYGTFILFQSLNAYPLCSLRHWIQKPTQNQCYPDIFPSRLYTNQNHAGHSIFSLFSYFNPLEIRKISNHFHTKAF